MSETLDKHLDNKTEVHTEPTVSRDGIDMIRRTLQQTTGKRFYHSEINTIMEGREFVNKRGKLAKRIKRNLKKYHELKITPEIMSEIGNIANRHTLRDGTYIVEITRDLAGTVGMFGDSDSCFQEDHENEHHLFAMDDNSDFYAVRIYRQSGSSLARSWGYDSGAGFVVFNAYGMLLHKIASITSKALNEDARQVQFSFDGWLNDRHCWAIGGDPKATTFSAHCHPERYQNGHGGVGVCAHCDSTIYEDDSYHMADWGDMYCNECWNNQFHRCDHCHQWHEKDQVHLQRVRGLHGTQRVCPDCRDSYTLCAHCDIRIHPHHITTANLGDLCSRCIENDTLICNDCDHYVYRSDVQYWQEDQDDNSMVRPLCAGCYQQRDDVRHGLSSTPDKTPICVSCQRWLPLSLNSEGQCETCAKHPTGWAQVICGICGMKHDHPDDPDLFSDCEHCSQCYTVAQHADPNIRAAVIVDRPCAMFCSISDDRMNCVECVQGYQIANVHLITPTFNSETIQRTIGHPQADYAGDDINPDVVVLESMENLTVLDTEQLRADAGPDWQIHMQDNPADAARAIREMTSYLTGEGDN